LSNIDKYWVNIRNIRKCHSVQAQYQLIQPDYWLKIPNDIWRMGPPAKRSSNPTRKTSNVSGTLSFSKFQKLGACASPCLSNY
jgi:hypothetical protein